MWLIKRSLIVLTMLFCTPLVSATEINWEGVQWQIRSGSGRPCATGIWDEKNVWVDNNNWLHLKIGQQPSGEFSCAEITSVERFGFGNYEVEIEGPIGAIDSRVVLGIFMYPPRDVGPDGTNELDIEIARWGHPDAPQVNYTAWFRSHKGNRTAKIRVPDTLNQARFLMAWQRGQVRWTSTLPDAKSVGFEGDVADLPQRLVINLWLFQKPFEPIQSGAEFVIKHLKRS